MQQTLDSIDLRYRFIFARHCIKGLQVSMQCADSVRAARWFQICLVHGVPQWMLRNNFITRNAYQFHAVRYASLKEDSFHQIYISGIDTNLASQLNRIFKTDQLRTNRINNGTWILRWNVYALQWLHHNKKQAKWIKKETIANGFPGEKRAGIPPWYFDSAKAYSNIHGYGPFVQDYRAYYMLIHYFSGHVRDMNQVLQPQVSTGFLPPQHFASFNDFLAENHRKGKYQFYNQWHSDPDTAQLKAINERRLLIGLAPWSPEMEQNNNWKKKAVSIDGYLEILKELY